MDEITDRSLIGGGDCFAHWHSADRVPSSDMLHGLQAIAKQQPVTGDYQATINDDYLLVDTSAGDVTITLPMAVGGNEVEILKMSSAYTVIVLPMGTDTILTTTGVTISTGDAAIHFKSFGTDWRPI